LWNSDGRELFYYLPPGVMMAVTVETGPSFKAGRPKMVFRGNYPQPTDPGLQYSVTRDGRRFLMKKPVAATSDGSASQINIVLNWIEEIKQRVPSGKK